MIDIKQIVCKGRIRGNLMDSTKTKYLRWTMVHFGYNQGIDIGIDIAINQKQ